MSQTPGAKSALWEGALHWFGDWPVGDVPDSGSLVYTIWDRSGRFIYVGISGRTTQQSARSKGPFGRIFSHARGNRSGDQFLIYVCDRLVLPRLGNRISEISEGTLSLDLETRNFVSENLGFRWFQRPVHRRHSRSSASSEQGNSNRRAGRC